LIILLGKCRLRKLFARRLSAVYLMKDPRLKRGHPSRINSL
jgi:hypothetical protein